MKNKYCIILTCILLLSSITIFSQEEYFSPSTESSILIDGFASKQGLYTGSPSISIPLYTIKADNMEIPIYLTYNSKGLQIHQSKPQIGLGWGLVNGGRITRIVKKLPDDINRVYRELIGNTEPEQFNVGFIYSGGEKSESLYTGSRKFATCGTKTTKRPTTMIQ